MKISPGAETVVEQELGANVETANVQSCVVEMNGNDIGGKRPYKDRLRFGTNNTIIIDHTEHVTKDIRGSNVELCRYPTESDNGRFVRRGGQLEE